MIEFPISLLYTLIAGFVISTIALIGFLTLFFARELLGRIVTGLVSFAGGTLIGGAFFHLIPESIEQGGPVFLMIVVGITFFFVLETFLYLHHHHLEHQAHGLDSEQAVKPSGPLILIGDGIHNIADGVIIASGFVVSVELGIVTAFIAALHEVPQEIGDYGVLINAGYGRRRALILNYAAALTIFIGAFGFFIFSELIENLTIYTIPFAAGSFIYIALADLLAEVKEKRGTLVRKLFHLASFGLGVTILWLAGVIFG